jgi:alkaline phosphatase D
MHGVKSGLELQKSGDLKKALAKHNPEVAPHLSFMDLGGHGYAVVRAGADALDVEFVCIRRPLERSETPDGGPLAYRVVHHLKLWARGEAPRLEKKVIEGTPPLIV